MMAKQEGKLTNALATQDSGLDLPALSAVAGDIGASAPLALSKRKKAAVIVRLLLSEGGEINLSTLPEDVQEELTLQMSQMRFINRSTLRAVIDEFVREIEDIGLSFPSGLEGALSVLNGSISEATAARIRRQGGVKISGDPWATISGLDPARILPVLEEESTEGTGVVVIILCAHGAKGCTEIWSLPQPRSPRVLKNHSHSMSPTESNGGRHKSQKSVAPPRMDEGEIGEGENDNSAPLSGIYPDADRLALFAITMGAEVSNLIAELVGSNDIALG